MSQTNQPTASEKLAVVTRIWEKDLLQSQATLSAYCQAVASRYKTMFGEEIPDPTPEAIYDALNRKDLL